MAHPIPVLTRMAPSKSIHSLANKSNHPPCIYKLEAAHSLPVVNLRLTLSWLWLTPEQNLRFLKWSRRRYRLFAYLHRLGIALGLLVLLLPRWIGWYLTGPAVLSSLPALLCTSAMLSCDLLWTLTHYYEFWFFTGINACTWITCAWLLCDGRISVVVIYWVEIQLAICMDANFRTFVPALRTSVLVTVPSLLIIALAIWLRIPDLPTTTSSTTSVQVAHLHVDLIDVFLNTLSTLVLYLLRMTYNKRQLLSARNATSRMIRCMIVRATLSVQPMAGGHVAEDGSGRHLHRRNACTTRVVLKQLGITAHKMLPMLKTGKPLNHRQQLTLVSLRLSTIDVRRTIYPRWPVHYAFSTRWLVGLYVLGAWGLLGSAVGLVLPAFLIPSSSSSSMLLILFPVSGWLATMLFFAIFCGAYQRDVARAMFRNFAFLFPSVQFAIASLCLADALQWDHRSWAIGAFIIWFHWILLLDALTPPVRSQLRVNRQIALPVVVCIGLGLVSTCYAIGVDSVLLRDRALFNWNVGSHTLTVGIKTVLLSRILTILIWTVRLAYQIVLGTSTHTHHLVLLRGTLDYFCPFDTISGMKPSPKSLAVVTPAVAHPRGRRDSEGSLLLPNESSFRRGSWMLASAVGLTRRGSSTQNSADAAAAAAAAAARTIGKQPMTGSSRLVCVRSPSAPCLTPQSSQNNVTGSVPLTDKERHVLLTAALFAADEVRRPSRTAASPSLRKWTVRMPSRLRSRTPSRPTSPTPVSSSRRRSTVSPVAADLVNAREPIAIPTVS